MKILGHSSLKPRTKSVVIGLSKTGEPLELVLTAPSVTIDDRLAREIPEPIPPLVKGETERDARGRVMKDSHGRPIPKRNPDDPKYQEKLKRVTIARSAAMLLICAGDQIKPSVKKEDFENPIDYYVSVMNELGEANLDAGALSAIGLTVSELMRPISQSEVEEAKAALALDEDSQEGVAEGK